MNNYSDVLRVYNTQIEESGVYLGMRNSERDGEQVLVVKERNGKESAWIPAHCRYSWA